MKKARHAQLKKDAARSWYQFSAFEKRRAIAAFSTKRFHMNFSGDHQDAVVISHRKHFCQLAEVPFENLVALEQVHGANIVRLGTGDAGKGARDQASAIHGTDGAVTNSTDVVLSVRTADCAPLFFLDPEHRAIGIAHVGWRGASGQLASKMVQAFRGQFLTRPQDLVVAVGPLIRACCYEVGSEFKDVFGSFVSKRAHRLYFDLTRWIRDDLMAEGVAPEHVYDSGLCTACFKDRFPSYRRDGKQVSHMMSVLKLS